MGIHILYGESRSDLTKTCLEQVYQFRTDHPHDRAILLVPETSKMDMEYEILTGTDRDGMMLTEVLSFSRFCYRILGEIGAGSDQLIDDAGKSMLLYKILKKNEGRLDLFKNLCQKPGFVSEILSVMGDFRRVLIDAPKLSKASSEMSDRVLAKKAGEFSILLEQYDLELKETGLLDPQENYTRTTQHLRALVKEKSLPGGQPLPWPHDRLEWLFHAGIWITGFGETRDFTPQEYAMIEALSHCCDLWITLVYDKISPVFRAGEQSMAWFSKSGLQKSVLRVIPEEKPTIFTRLAYAWKDQSPVPCSSVQSDPIPSVNPDLIPSAPADGLSSGQVALIHSSTKRQEAALVAGEIKRLVREENMRYRDIFIAAAGMDSTGAIIRATFQEASIPYYMDEKKSLGRTALARMIQSLLELCLYNWSHKALMKYARCGLCSATSGEIDEFETFMLSRGIRWKSQIFDDRRFDRGWFPDSMNPSAEEPGEETTEDPCREFIEEPCGESTEASRGKSVPDAQRMIELRDRLCKNVLVFEKNCGKSRTGKQYCQALRDFLQAEEIQGKVDRTCDSLLRQKQEDAATAMVKAWNELLHLLEQTEQICQDTPMDLELFRGILQNGMQKAVSGTIPSAVDQVHFAPVDQIGERQRPVLFIIGLTDSAYPEKLSSEGLLKDREREAFSEYFGISIPSAFSDKYYEDLFRTYSLLSLPTRRLYLSCPEPEDHESRIISFVRECVPDCRKIAWSEHPGPFDLQIYSGRTAFHTLVSMTESSVAGAHAHPGWAALRQVLLRDPELGDRLLALEGKPKMSQTKIVLSKEKILSRYRDPVAMSVSQLEAYSACSYSHFAKYLLKLKPRVTWDLQSSDTGSLLHGIVEIAVKQFLEEYKAAKDEQERAGVLSRYQLMDFEDLAFDKMREVIRRDDMGAFLDKGFFASKGRTSCHLAASTLQAVFGQFETSGFLPAILEWEFSHQNGNALNFLLPGFPLLSFHGKIDRVDLDGSYFRVIDYKSGSRAIDFDRWYHGLSLQLPAYIAAFAGQHPGMKPREAAYMQFMRPILLYESGSVSEIEQKHAQNMKKQYQLRKTGMEPEELGAAASHAVEKMKDLSSGLLNGKYDVKPKKTGTDTPCDYCEFMSICGFESKYDSFTVLEPLGRMRDEQGKALPKSAVFIKKITGEDKI